MRRQRKSCGQGSINGGGGVGLKFNQRELLLIGDLLRREPITSIVQEEKVSDNLLFRRSHHDDFRLLLIVNHLLCVDDRLLGWGL